MKEMMINENEVRTALVVLEELFRKPYSELNTMYGSQTIKEMLDLKKRLNDWYQPEVNGKIYDEEYGWIDPNEDF